MSRVHFVVAEVDKIRYQSQATREGKSLGAWLREAAAEKLSSGATKRFASVEEFDEYIARCQERAAAGGGPDREPDWEETKKLILDSKIRGLDEFA